MTNQINAVLLSAIEVKERLDEIGYGKEFSIAFIKGDGTLREVHKAVMEPPKGPPKHPDLVPVRNVSEGKWASFYIDKVVEILV